MSNAEIARQLFDTISDEYRMKTQARGIYEKAVTDPESVFHPDELQLLCDALSSVNGARICVIGSGDNVASMALCRMGATVTSVDVSLRQIENARDIAHGLGIEMEYIHADAMKLPTGLDDCFDLVYSTGGFLTFVSDLHQLFASVERVLKTDGTYVSFDTHPFMWPFESRLGQVGIRKPYGHTGPFTRACVFHWRVQDIVNALVEARIRIVRMSESQALSDTFWSNGFPKSDECADTCDWRENGLAALPQWLGILAEKHEFA